MKAVIFPYKVGSEGARELAKALGTICVYPDRKYVWKRGHVVITWGAGVYPRWWNRALEGQVLNQPPLVATAANKLRTLEQLQRVGVQVPEFTRDRVQAISWRDSGATVVSRATLTGSEGRGIVLVERGQEMPQVPLYTKHLRHKQEYRVHVMKDSVIDVVQKRKRSDFPDDQRNSLVRNWRFGWVFAHEGVNPPADVLEQARRAVTAMQLDFGAVDIAYREKEGRAYVLEINTAPGIEGSTVGRYAEAIQRVLR